MFINVVIGGGRMKFLPKTKQDFLLPLNGTRIDERNLIQEWIDRMSHQDEKHKKRTGQGKKFKFIWNATDFRQTNFKEYDHVLSLLAYDHMRFEADRHPDAEPSLSEMTMKAIDLLSQNENGYFLLVEGGRIDHGHHSSRIFISKIRFFVGLMKKK